MKNERDMDRIDVAHVAHLARLHLDDDEAHRLQCPLDDVVRYVQTISRLDLSGIEPTSHAQRVENVFRADEVAPGLDHDMVMSNAPAVKDDHFRVPKIIE